MDDPTRRCENDTGFETRPPGLPNPSGSPIFCTSQCFRSAGLVAQALLPVLFFANPLQTAQTRYRRTLQAPIHDLATAAPFCTTHARFVFTL